MGEYESRMKYARSIGADVRKPCLDRRTTSQRVSDEMKDLRAKNVRLWDALDSFMNLHVSGEKYGPAARDVWEEAVSVLEYCQDKKGEK